MSLSLPWWLAGFDCVSTLAEEVKNPAVDMPVGIVGCISVVGVICE